MPTRNKQNDTTFQANLADIGVKRSVRMRKFADVRDDGVVLVTDQGLGELAEEASRAYLPGTRDQVVLEFLHGLSPEDMYGLTIHYEDGTKCLVTTVFYLSR